MYIYIHLVRLIKHKGMVGGGGGGPRSNLNCGQRSIRRWWSRLVWDLGYLWWVVSRYLGR